MSKTTTVELCLHGYNFRLHFRINFRIGAMFSYRNQTYHSQHQQLLGDLLEVSTPQEIFPSYVCKLKLASYCILSDIIGLVFV